METAQWPMVKSDKGRLVLDFQWKGVRCREHLGMNDTKEGRARPSRPSASTPSRFLPAPCLGV